MYDPLDSSIEMSKSPHLEKRLDTNDPNGSTVAPEAPVVQWTNKTKARTKVIYLQVKHKISCKTKNGVQYRKFQQSLNIHSKGYNGI